MNDQKHYDDLVQRLAKHNYTVFMDEEGFVVRHVIDRKDVSRIRTIFDLVDVVELIEWREQRKAEQSSQM